MTIRPILAFFLALSLFSCEQVSDSLSEAEVAEGLRSALKVGTDTATTILGVKDGYYGDEIVKILLPPEADVILDYADNDPTGIFPGLIEDVILGINRAAEHAATEAAPIFWGAITEMTIVDAFNILNGADNAATEYLKSKTNTKLFNLYNPTIESALDRDIIGNVSANDSWETLTSKWNIYANSIAGQILGHQPVNTDLDAYLTQKALDGLFIKIADEEKNIRHDPIARVNDILKKVFGD